MRSHLYRPFPKLLDVVNVPAAYSFDYACQLITIPARQTPQTDGREVRRGARGRMSKHKESSGPPTALINSHSQDINSALSLVIEILPH